MLADLLQQWGLNRREGKPRVGVSACLLGRAVRYNGETRYHAPTAEALEAWIELREFCPEVGIGLPVPRPPIQVVQLAQGQHVRGVEDPDRDFTSELAAYAGQLPADLDGFILKARSPSCGLGSTPLFDQDDREIGTTSGGFAARLQSRLPLLPLCDEAELEHERGRLAFITRTWLHRLWRQGDERLCKIDEQLPESLRDVIQPWWSRLGKSAVSRRR